METPERPDKTKIVFYKKYIWKSFYYNFELLFHANMNQFSPPYANMNHLTRTPAELTKGIPLEYKGVH